MKAITETGSVYEIDVEAGLWRRNRGHSNRDWGMKTLPADAQPETWGETFELLSCQPLVDEPVLGERLFVSGKDEWYLSTTVVRIEK